MNILQRLLWRVRLRPSLGAHTVGTMAVPSGQHQELSADEKFRQEHGYSAGFEPEAWTDDITQHNRAVDDEYREEIEDRKHQMRLGTYTPRFVRHDLDVLPDPTNPEHVNWHLEMTLDPGRRLNLTKDAGLASLPIPSDDQVAALRVQQRIGRSLEALDPQADPDQLTPRHFIGSRKAILDACHGNEAMADRVEAKARQAFGVSDLDAPLPPVEAVPNVPDGYGHGV